MLVSYWAENLLVANSFEDWVANGFGLMKDELLSFTSSGVEALETHLAQKLRECVEMSRDSAVMLNEMKQLLAPLRAVAERAEQLLQKTGKVFALLSRYPDIEAIAHARMLLVIAKQRESAMLSQVQPCSVKYREDATGFQNGFEVTREQAKANQKLLQWWEEQPITLWKAVEQDSAAAPAAASDTAIDDASASETEFTLFVEMKKTQGCIELPLKDHQSVYVRYRPTTYFPKSGEMRWSDRPRCAST